MEIKQKKLILKPLYPILNLGLALLLLSCAPVEKKQGIKIDGSSTVYPITKVIADNYKSENKDVVDMEVNFSGTTDGFQKFCEGKTDIANASRPIEQQEIELCNRNKIRFVELPIAFDALTVVVNQANNWVQSLTVEELRKMWEPSSEGKIKRWNQIKPDFPDQPLNLYGAGDKSGTFDYFTGAIVGTERASRSDYVKTEDDEITVRGVEQDPNALGYFGFAYYKANQKKLKAVPIDGGKGAVPPAQETVENAQYQPLSRPLFIYVNLAAAQNNPDLKNFVEYYIKQAPSVVSQVGYIPLPGEGYHLATVTWQKGEVGTVFEGKPQIGLTIGELLRKKAKF
ncbi:MAG: PstS family phosphate ABC transporter substrate-binding protein [Chlorogloea purpurea SAG 13.99]|nr:PstS family phosphate ABC transporter substrate-binding protein [Chlorogloea purpurea SAG 13.99]